MANHKIEYVELPAHATGSLKKFYGDLFGWSFQDYGPSYTAFTQAGVLGGFNANNAQDRSNAPLIVIESDNLEQTLDSVQKAGGNITVPIFSFPGGRRFHFRDPEGNELAVMQPE